MAKQVEIEFFSEGFEQILTAPGTMSAVESAAAGADKIRSNPGNIGGEDRVKAVVTA